MEEQLESVLAPPLLAVVALNAPTSSETQHEQHEQHEQEQQEQHVSGNQSEDMASAAAPVPLALRFINPTCRRVGCTVVAPARGSWHVEYTPQ